MYIIFEGIDTTGKSTQIELLESAFDNLLTIKEPGGTKVGKEIREIILNSKKLSKRSELFLFLADRAQLIDEVIKKNIDKKIIVSDRGFISGIAYALANGGFNMDTLIELNRYALDGIVPNLIFFFKIDKETLVKRLNQKSIDNIELRGVDYLMKVQDYMQKVLDRLDLEYIEIDSQKSKDEIYREIVNNIKRRVDG